jgi:hypothetical protein
VHDPRPPQLGEDVLEEVPRVAWAPAISRALRLAPSGAAASSMTARTASSAFAEILMDWDDLPRGDLQKSWD